MEPSAESAPATRSYFEYTREELLNLALEQEKMMQSEGIKTINLLEEIERMRQQFREADERADRLHAENGELEQEMADLRNELLIKNEMLARAGALGKEAFEEAVRRAKVVAVGEGQPGEVVMLGVSPLTRWDRIVLLTVAVCLIIFVVANVYYAAKR